MWRRGVAVLLLLAVGCGPSERTRDGQVENGLIAAPNEKGIALLREDGTLVRTIPGTKGMTQPVWSPDGKLLAVNDGLDVLIVDPDGKGAKAIIDNASSASWSPDGTRLVVMRDICGDNVQCGLELDNPHELFVVDADGEDARRLTTHPGYDGDPHWSPDGDWIAFTGDDGIYLIRPDGSDRKRILAGDVPFVRGWSPDAKKLLYEQVEGDPAIGIEIEQLDVETGEILRLTHAPGHQLLPAWSPDGEKIAFLTTEECRRTGECTAHEPWEVWIMDADGKNGHRITGGGYGPPSWAPEG